MAAKESCNGEVLPAKLTPCSPSRRRKFDQLSSSSSTPTDFQSWRVKRMKESSDRKDTNTSPSYISPCYNAVHSESKYKSLHNLYSDPLSIPLKDELERSIYGSVTKDIEYLHARRIQLLSSLSLRHLDFLTVSPRSGQHSLHPLDDQSNAVSPMVDKQKRHLAFKEIVDLEDDCVLIDSLAVEDSDSLCKPSAKKTPGYICKNGLSVNAPVESLHYIKKQSVDNDLQSCKNRPIVIVDSDEEEENAELMRPAQVSEDKLDAFNFEIPSSSNSQCASIKDFNYGNNLSNHLGTTFFEVQSDDQGNRTHMSAESVPCAVDYASQSASFRYNEVALENPNDGKATKKSADCPFFNPANVAYILALPVPIPGKGGGTFGLRKGTIISSCDVTWRLSQINLEGIEEGQSKVAAKEQKTLVTEVEPKKDEGVYVGVKDDVVSNARSSEIDSEDCLGELWREMAVALEINKDSVNCINDDTEYEEEQECDHSFLLKDDLGYVCRVCGIINKSIDKIFEYQWSKVCKTRRTYISESDSVKEREENDYAPSSGVDSSQSHDMVVFDISVHPMHRKEMKSHQLAGFSFLVKNLMSDDPGGCILAHAPGSGKTFMVISFIQSFIGKDPDARPLVVLPKGILSAWKNEFKKWQVQDIPLYDFYSAKAESRKEQLDVLEKWVANRGVLFLGYKQLASIVCKTESVTDSNCQDILLKVPKILIMDEGHTPRNRDTELVKSLEKVQTLRKVVLSGTLFQNKAKEVFTILNLVRPKFLKSNASKNIKKRVMIRGEIGRKHINVHSDEVFFEVVEETLQNDENPKRKAAVINDLREMTKDVLHYYKGDFLDELPGLVDFTVHLNLTQKQKYIVDNLNLKNFKGSSLGTAVYVHPQLKEFSHSAIISEKGCNFNEAKLDNLITKIDVRDGVKAKFFLDILGLCESSGEKLLVFSQYLLPLKFLERLVVNRKGWSPGIEIFMINGDTSPEDRERSMERFNNSSSAKVFFGSIKACGEGISLVGASRVLIMDVHLNPSVTRQAIGRAFRPGQLRKVFVYRLVASDSPEEESHKTCIRKELISKMWFEWDEFYNNSNFDMETVNLKDCDDEFWGSSSLREDVRVVKKR